MKIFFTKQIAMDCTYDQLAKELNEKQKTLKEGQKWIVGIAGVPGSGSNAPRVKDLREADF